MSIPTIKSIVDANIARYESKLGQTVSLQDKAFFRVLSQNQGAYHASLYRYAENLSKQNLVLTAQGEFLDNIGRSIRPAVYRKTSVSSVLTATATGSNGSVISSGIAWYSPDTGIRYNPVTNYTIVTGSAVMTLTAETSGSTGNISNGLELFTSSPQPGINDNAVILSTVTTGSDRESDSELRIRILDALRSIGGGGNLSDYRLWGQSVAGIVRAFPYSGRPINDPTPSIPPDRTVYLQCEESISPDGIPPAGLIAQARSEIITDPLTGKTRQPLGLTDDTLYIEPISRTLIYVEIRGLSVDPGKLSSLQLSMTEAMDLLLKYITPFIYGLDPIFDKKDVITDLLISGTAQDIIQSYGGYATGAGFGTDPGIFLSEYQLSQGETVKLGGVTYAA